MTADNGDSSVLTERQQRALDLVSAALVSENPAARLSDVIYDAHDYDMHEVHDGFEFDGEKDNGYDPDDLAAVLLPVLRSVAWPPASNGRTEP